MYTWVNRTVLHRPSIHIITVILRKYIRMDAYFFGLSTVDIDIKPSDRIMLSATAHRLRISRVHVTPMSINQSIVLRRTRCKKSWLCRHRRVALTTWSDAHFSDFDLLYVYYKLCAPSLRARRPYCCAVNCNWYKM